MDEICTIEALWEAAQNSEIKRTLSPTDESACLSAHDPTTSRQTKVKERSLRTRPDGIAHHNEKKILYLLEFKRTSDVRPDYFETKKDMTYKQYENLMNILRKAKNPGWTSDQLNFIVGSISINKKAMSPQHPKSLLWSLVNDQLVLGSSLTRNTSKHTWVWPVEVVSLWGPVRVCPVRSFTNKWQKCWKMGDGIDSLNKKY